LRYAGYACAYLKFPNNVFWPDSNFSAPYQQMESCDPGFNLSIIYYYLICNNQ
jgi:hypothetical protein